MGSSSVCECEPDRDCLGIGNGRGVGSRDVQGLPESKACASTGSPLPWSSPAHSSSKEFKRGAACFISWLQSIKALITLIRDLE